MKRIIDTDDAPAAVGAYSQATATDGLVFTGGQIPVTSDSTLLADDPIGIQTEQALRNVEAVRNEDPPARSAVGVDEFPRGVAVEVEAIATTV